MKYISSIAVCAALPLFLVITLSCGDRTVVARAGEHEITTGEFFRWLEARGDDARTVLRSKQEQRLKLRRLALELLIVDEAGRAKYDRSDDFVFLMAYLERNFCSGYCEERMARDGWFEGEVAEVREIGVSPGTDAGKNERIREHLAGIAAGIRAGVPLDRAVAMNGAVKLTAPVIYICPGLKDTEYTDVVFSLSEGEAAALPVESESRLYLPVMMKKYRVNPDNFETVVRDEGPRSLMKPLLVQRTIDFLTRSLRLSGDVVDNTSAAGDGLPDALLFSAGDVKFTGADLDRLLRLVYAGKGAGRAIEPVSKKMRIDWAESVLTELLFCRYACGRGICDDDRYGEAWKANRRHAIVNRYVDEVILSGVTVTADDIMKEYGRGNEMITRAKQKNIIPRNTAAMPPLSLLWNRIHDDLLQRKKNDAKRRWEAELLMRKGFSVVESELLGI